MKTVRLDIKTLKAALQCCGKADVRYYMNGVFVEGNRIVATNGERMMLARGLESDEGIPPIIIDYQLIEKAIKNAPKGSFYIPLTYVENVYTLGGEVITGIEGHFPDYRRILPKGELQYHCNVLPDGRIQQPQPAHLVAALKAAMLLGATVGEPFQYDATGRAIISAPQGYIIVMPMTMQLAQPLPVIPD